MRRLWTGRWWQGGIIGMAAMGLWGCQQDALIQATTIQLEGALNEAFTQVVSLAVYNLLGMPSPVGF